MIEYASAYHPRPASVLREAQRHVSRAEASYDEAKRQASLYGGTVTFDTVSGLYRRVVPPGVRTELARRASVTPTARRARLAKLEGELMADALNAMGRRAAELHRRSVAMQSEPLMVPRVSPRQRLDQIERDLRPAPTRWR
jgi:hypothetical protein